MGVAEFSNGQLVGTLEGRFPWGLVVIADEGSVEPVPAWDPNDAPVTPTRSSLVVKIQHEQEGPAVVHVYKGVGDLVGEPAFTGSLMVESGALTVGDALAAQVIRVPVSVGAMSVRVVFDRPTQAVHVDVILD